MMTDNAVSRRRRRLWRFGEAEFDEASWTLRVAGTPVALEAKPLTLLHELLLRAGEVVTKDELLDSVWTGVTVVEGSLATAVSKLRRVLADEKGAIIATVPRIGYRLAVPVAVESIEAPLTPRFAFAPGDSVPGRRQWVLDKALSESGAADVWRATHAKTGEHRVFKFADTPDRLRALKREAAVARLIGTALGTGAPTVRLFEWNFETDPYFLEQAWGGDDLLRWSAEAGGLAALPIDRRIAVAIELCRAVEAVHRLGVLHRDLKPANILIAQDGAKMHVRLIDFGNGQLVDGEVLRAFNVTDPGPLDAGESHDRSGTFAYRAPELIGDAPATVASDVYALGLIVFQLVAGDWSLRFSPGWEAAIADPLLREDIALASAGAPAERLAGAAALADRLDTLDVRRAAAARLAAEAAQAAERQRLEERRIARRPWMRAAVAGLALGLLGTSAMAIYATQQRNRAVAERRIADASYAFLAEEVLARPDPSKSAADESVMDAIKNASDAISKRFSGQPDVGARLYLAMAGAFQQRGDVDTARSAYDRADRLFAVAGQKDADDARIGRMQRAQMEALAGSAEGLARAKQILAQERAALGPRSEAGLVGFRLAASEGASVYMTDPHAAELDFRRALAIAQRTPDAIPLPALLKMRTSLALTLMRQGDAAAAEPIMRDVVARSALALGPDHPDTLVARQNLLNSQGLQGKSAEVIAGATGLLPVLTHRFGANHRLTLALRSTRFEALAAQGRYTEAAADAEQVWRGASTVSGAHSHQALVGQTDYGATLCQAGAVDKGLAITSDALAGVEQAFPADYPLRHVIAYYDATCLLAAHRGAQARPLLASIDRKLVGSLIGDAHWGPQVDAGLAEAALDEGDVATARTAFEKARAGAGDSNDPQFQATMRKLGTMLQKTGA